MEYVYRSSWRMGYCYLLPACRVIESLVLMGNPVFHGACSTLLGILLLGFSESFVFSVFFRMMVMVRRQ